MVNDKISIIIPTHNSQDFLAACVDSVLKQAEGGFDREIIIVDGGSTDRTVSICRDLEAKQEIIRVITMEDLGVSAARNAGLCKATGNYLLFLDADDRLLPGILAYLYQAAKRTDSDIVGCGFSVWHDEKEFGELLARTSIFLADDLTGFVSYTGSEYIDKGILNNDTRCWSKLYRRESIRGVKFTENISIGEDMLFVLAALKKAGKITVTARPGYAYYLNPQGAMLKPFQASYMDQIACWQIAREQIRRIRPDLDYRAAKKIIVAVMLTVGKIAVLPAALRGQYWEYVEKCRAAMTEAVTTPGAFRLLDRGYRLKVRVFRLSPALYIRLYHLWKV